MVAKYKKKIKLKQKQQLRRFPKAQRKRFQNDHALEWKEWNKL